MKIAELKAELDARGIEYAETASPQKLLTILNEVLEEAGEEIVELEIEKGAEKKISPLKKKHVEVTPNTSIPPQPDFVPPKQEATKGEPGGPEYQSQKLVAGKTEKIKMRINLRHDGERFVQGKEYTVPTALATKLKTEDWAV